MERSITFKILKRFCTRFGHVQDPLERKSLIAGVLFNSKLIGDDLEFIIHSMIHRYFCRKNEKWILSTAKKRDMIHIGLLILHLRQKSSVFSIVKKFRGKWYGFYLGLYRQIPTIIHLEKQFNIFTKKKLLQYVNNINSKGYKDIINLGIYVDNLKKQILIEDKENIVPNNG